MKQSLVDIRHVRSEKDFPFLKLDQDEYVEMAITRSKSGLFFIWFCVLVVFLLLTLVILLFSNTINTNPGLASSANSAMITIFLIVSYFAVALFGFIATKVYTSNKLFITNKHIIQFSRNTLFAQSTNIIELKKIEDVSFRQTGVIEYLLHIGTIRLATVGDETTYTIRYVDVPSEEIQTISKLIRDQKEN